MVLKYKLKENDELQMSLYFFKEEKTLKKVIIKNLTIWLIIYSIIILIFFFNNQKFGAIITSIVAIIALILYPFRIKEIYFKRIKKETELYETRFNQTLILEIVDGFFKVTGNESEYKINISALDKIIETKQHFFIKLKPDVIIIPKSEIENQNFVKNELMKLAEKQKIEFEHQINWKW